MRKIMEKGMEVVFLLIACVSIVAVALVCIFLFAKGFPAIHEIGFVEFITGTVWRPLNDLFGILPFILGSIYVTAGALVIGVPVGIFMAIYMAKFCPEKVYKVAKPIVNLLAGIPSIVYGFFGLMVVVPYIRDYIGGRGNSMLAACIILGIMILPTIIGVSEAAIKAVPDSYYEGALALGASKEVSVFKAVVPAAKSGIMAAVTLGIGRAIGETMAVIMVAGNNVWMPQGILEGVRTLTSNIVLEMGYSQGLHRNALIATGVVLFVFILFINLTFSFFNRKKGNA